MRRTFKILKMGQDLCPMSLKLFITKLVIAREIGVFCNIVSFFAVTA